MEPRAMSAIKRAINYLELDMDKEAPFSERRKALLQEVENLRGILRRLKNV